MFTGLVEGKGEVVSVSASGEAQNEQMVLGIKTPFAPQLRLGDSVATAGVCLTVTEIEKDMFYAYAMPETMRLTTLGQLAAGDAVNLERAVRPSDRLGGHIVSGHVDGIGTVQKIRRGEQWKEIIIEAPKSLMRQIALKGSIAIDGVSLTVTGVGETWFSIGLIPATLQATTLGTLAEGSRVNLETDTIAKYVQRLMETK
ncbi:riboflavin synthase [Gleimia hominis]|uniref:Riboflavin synthase n=1 Tax=Gleimia hominis TaxID=595468 RepID=A0ABU3I996_9ACTO|nr:riboflavin synthase [Gleimia hominis]MDT3766944.1 riboflavin synthase [Gleimia hominis]